MCRGIEHERKNSPSYANEIVKKEYRLVIKFDNLAILLFYC